MPPNSRPDLTKKEGRIILALQAFNNQQFKSLRAAARAYNVTLAYPPESPPWNTYSMR